MNDAEKNFIQDLCALCEKHGVVIDEFDSDYQFNTKIVFRSSNMHMDICDIYAAYKQLKKGQTAPGVS